MYINTKYNITCVFIWSLHPSILGAFWVLSVCVYVNKCAAVSTLQITNCDKRLKWQHYEINTKNKQEQQNVGTIFVFRKEWTQVGIEQE